MGEREYTIPTLGDEGRDHDQLEGAVAAELARNPDLEATDGEPGEWVTLSTKDATDRVTITIIA